MESKQLGDLLKKRREEMNISLKEAENATSIRVNYLLSIEEGKPEKLISPVYAEGFIKQYASFLGLDGEQVIKDNSHLFLRNTEQQFDFGIGTLEMRGTPGSSVKWMPNKWILALGASLLGSWFLGYMFGWV